jgi:hypothetical protein
MSKSVGTSLLHERQLPFYKDVTQITHLILDIIRIIIEYNRPDYTLLIEEYHEKFKWNEVCDHLRYVNLYNTINYVSNYINKRYKRLTNDNIWSFISSGYTPTGKLPEKYVFHNIWPGERKYDVYGTRIKIMSDQVRNEYTDWLKRDNSRNQNILLQNSDNVAILEFGYVPGLTRPDIDYC